ncbi:hypothetical protein PanWU01x14_184520 [Parasponia andersonii]|uniref:Uncharacterized protein n=1 Tax=Parasponia andersonii TaxID=3476 RepID=A0A2P5C4N7_PARAD|nr:hypothetical protein PanWU01x14_184520 [Parasponia andersonii]
MLIFSSHAPLQSSFSFKVAIKNSKNRPSRCPSRIPKDPFYSSLAAWSNLAKKLPEHLLAPWCCVVALGRKEGSTTMLPVLRSGVVGFGTLRAMVLYSQHCDA